MDKINELLAAAFAITVSTIAWTAKKMFSRIERLENNLADVERNLLTREDIQQIKDTQTLILQHLLEHRKTESRAKPMPKHRLE
jgi:hypothetical protein